MDSYFKRLFGLSLWVLECEARPGKYDINVNVERFYNSSIKEMEREIALADLEEEKLLEQIHKEDEVVSMLPIVITISALVTILIFVLTYIAVKYRFLCLLFDNIKIACCGEDTRPHKPVQRTESNAHVIQPSSTENSSSEGELSPQNFKKGSVVAPYAALKNKTPHELIRNQTHSMNVNNQPIARVGTARGRISGGSSIVGRLESLPVGASTSIGTYLQTRSVSSFADNRSMISKKTDFTDVRSTYSGKTSKSGGSNGSKGNRGISTGQISQKRPMRTSYVKEVGSKPQMLY